MSINTPQSTINCYHHLFFVNTVVLWNSVPFNILKLTDPNQKSFWHSLSHYNVCGLLFCISVTNTLYGLCLLCMLW